MKMVKSLLLGTAAGLVAVAGAQAADMPVKAKPVLYVKICSLYGDGFYYIPGTDICLKLGGYVRFQTYWDYGTNATTGPFGAPNQLDTRTGGQTDLTYRTRSLISVDTRQQTEWGTLRTYFTVGHTGDFAGRRGDLRQPRLHPVRGLHPRLGVVVLRLLLLADRDLLLGPDRRHR